MTAAPEAPADARRGWVPPTRTLTVGGRQVEPAGGRFEVFDPATEQVVATVGEATTEQVDAAVRAARDAFPAWAALSGEERGRHLHRLADTLSAHADQLVASIVTECGTPIALAEFMQVRMAVDHHLRWAADAAARDRTVHLGAWDVPVPTMSDVVHDPVGVIAAITGYNFPINLAVFKFASALAAGCTVVLLPSPRTPLTTLFIGALLAEAGLPPGVMNVVVGGVEVGRALTTHPGVDRVSFTGSDAVGAQIMAQAAGTLKGVTLELGGKSPSIVMPDVDLAAVVDELHLRWSRNGGQGCAALARLLVHESRYDEFLERSAGSFAKMVVGDPWDPAVNIAPMIRPEHRARVQGYIDGALADGGRALLEVTTPLPERGWYVNPVLIGDLPPQARLVQEEVFGPVAVVLPFRDTDDAVRLANDTVYGLGASVWCNDPALARSVALRVRAGTVWINGGGSMRPDAPFGGYGRSGVGRELGEWGMQEYLEAKHIQWRI